MSKRERQGDSREADSERERTGGARRGEGGRERDREERQESRPGEAGERRSAAARPGPPSAPGHASDQLTALDDRDDRRDPGACPPVQRLLSSVFTGTRCPGPTAPPGVAAVSRAQLAWKRSQSLHIHLPALHSEGHANTATVNKQKPRKMPHRRVLAPEMQRKDNSRCSFQQPFPPMNNPL